VRKLGFRLQIGAFGRLASNAIGFAHPHRALDQVVNVPAGRTSQIQKSAHYRSLRWRAASTSGGARGLASFGSRSRPLARAALPDRLT